MSVREILLLGDPRLYEICAPVQRGELDALRPAIQDMRDTLLAFRARRGVGRAIAAPQVGLMRRVVFLERTSNLEGVADNRIATPTALINPVLRNLSDALVELWDDCMSFPDLLVRLRRHTTCDITFRDLNWEEHTVHLDGDLSELLQHECDHLDGVLAVSRAIDARAFAYRHTGGITNADG
ncbi:MAG: peptide deformylase [Anaerolineae bacterium]|jgi:peptide deformylase|nr:peptide deformylase [Anaerolineae bacterium]